MPEFGMWDVTYPRNLLETSSQGLKLCLDHLDHPSAQDIKKTGSLPEGVPHAHPRTIPRSHVQWPGSSLGKDRYKDAKCKVKNMKLVAPV
jgi:hypothetical protein